MKRDIELIRMILIKHSTGKEPEKLNAYSTDLIKYHYVLLHQAGLISATFADGNSDLPDDVHHVLLTWSGNDFLDSATDNKVWDLAKQYVLKPGISWTFSMLVEFLKTEAKKRFPIIPEQN